MNKKKNLNYLIKPPAPSQHFLCFMSITGIQCTTIVEHFMVIGCGYHNGVRMFSQSFKSLFNIKLLKLSQKISIDFNC